MGNFDFEWFRKESSLSKEKIALLPDLTLPPITLHFKIFL
jgi:hypothetical protein